MSAARHNQEAPRLLDVVLNETVIAGNTHVREKVSKKLAAVNDDYPTKRSVLLLAEKILTPINNQTVTPESSQRHTDFIDNHYFPCARKALRPSTVKGYEKDIYDLHLRKRLGDYACETPRLR